MPEPSQKNDPRAKANDQNGFGISMSTNERLYKRAEEAIQELFSDTSVERETAKENLQGLRDHIATLIDSLED